MSIEVEIKVKIQNRKQIMDSLKKIGFLENRCVVETDIYYTSTHHNFAALGEALRIRTVKDPESPKETSVITYKGAKLDQVSMTRQELETEVGDGETVRKILEHIGFCPVSPVEKKRLYLNKDNMTACLDNVKGLGDYLELEILTDTEEKRTEALKQIEDVLEALGYIPTDDICYAVFGMLALNKPLLVEGAPGVGKTSLAKALAEVMGLPMLRLQMYDGLTKDEVLYDYDYQRQLLTLEAVKPKLNEEIKDLGINDAIKHVAGDVDFYGKEFLIPRPVLQTIDGSGRKLLLIDEIDKASEETEYMLYEYLEDYSIDIPQFGTVSCPEDQKPVVILTSNAYRELSGAMKRRCSYLYIKKKTRAEIIEVLKYRTSVDERVASGIASCMVAFQEMDLKHPVSVSEIVDWASYIEKDGSREGVQNSLGLLVKDRRDMEAVSATVRNYIHDIAY